MEYNRELFKIEGTTLVAYLGDEEEIIIPEGITEIESIKKDVKTIFIPSTVVKISSNATVSRKLQSINVSEDNTYFSSIEGVLFSKDKTRLICYPAARRTSQYRITSNVLHVEKYAFSGVEFPISIVIENGITQIGELAFCMCKGLQSISIPNSVISIGDEAFAHCENLLNISIPNSVASIGDECFFGCESLLNIVIPESVVTLAPKGYVRVEKHDETIFSKSGVFGCCRNLTSVIILGKITYIPHSAFSNCNNLRTVILPNTIRHICDFAFDGCKLLESINIPDEIDIVSECAFGWYPECPAIKGKKVRTSYGFEYNLDEMDIYGTTLIRVKGNYSPLQKIPDGITVIGKSAFCRTNNIVEKLEIPSSVKKVESMAFEGCKNLKEITIRNTYNVEIAGDYVRGANNLENVYADNPDLINFYEVKDDFDEYCDDAITGGYTESDFGCREEYLDWLENH